MARIFLFCCVCLAFFASCQPENPSGKKCLTLNIGSDPQTLDPRKARDLHTSTLARMLFEGLTRVSKQGSVELALAEKVDVSDDCKRFVFHLRNSFWSNGDPVRAQDFAASWKSALDPAFATDLAFQLYLIQGAEQAKKGEIGLDEVGIFTPDSHTLVVELVHPTPYFLQLLNMPIFFPLHPTALQNINWSSQPETYIGNGPFSLSSWKHSDMISVQKNFRYWEAGSVELDQMNLVMLNSDTEIRMFEEKKLDWAGSPLGSLPVDAVAHLKETDQLKISPFSGTYFFRVNTSDTWHGQKNPLSHPKLRQALALSIDRSAIVEHILQGGHLEAFTLVPPGMGLQTRIVQEASQAKQLCQEAFKEYGLDLNEPLIISFAGTERNVTIAQAIQKQWQEKLGITIVLEAVEPKIYFQRVSQKDFQLAAGSWIADFYDPINFLEVFKHKQGSTNNTGWEDGKYIDLLNRSALCKKSEERKLLLGEAEKILMEQMPMIPVFHYVMNFLQNEALRDVALSPIGQIDFRWARFEPGSSSLR
jgi:oligopeptide transport system substrate-binding protein